MLLGKRDTKDDTYVPLVRTSKSFWTRESGELAAGSRQATMVVFTCNACGDSIKKNKVQQHYEQQCPGCSILSCMDCGKDFEGDAYREHNRWGCERDCCSAGQRVRMSCASLFRAAQCLLLYTEACQDSATCATSMATGPAHVVYIFINWGHWDSLALLCSTVCWLPLYCR